MKKETLINHVTIKHDGHKLSIMRVRYFVGVYGVVYCDGSLMCQETFLSVTASNKKLRDNIKRFEKLGAEIEFTEIEVTPCGVFEEEDE
jgi:hypothetical protein